MQVYEQLNTSTATACLGNMALTSTFEGLTLDLRTGMDFNNEFRTQRKRRVFERLPPRRQRGRRSFRLLLKFLAFLYTRK